jgi:hypothetical protein
MRIFMNSVSPSKKQGEESIIPSGVYQAASGIQTLATRALSEASSAASTLSSHVQTTASLLATQAGVSAPRVLRVTDEILDFVPFGSLVSNVVNLGLKQTVLKDVDPESSQMKEYIEHVQKKETSKCLIYSVPFVGNAVKLGSVAYNYFYPATQKMKLDAPTPQLAGGGGGMSLEGAASADISTLPPSRSSRNLGEESATREIFAPQVRRRVLKEEDISRASTPARTRED